MHSNWKKQQIWRQKLSEGKYEPPITVKRKNIQNRQGNQSKKCRNNWLSIWPVSQIPRISINKSICCFRNIFMSSSLKLTTRSHEGHWKMLSVREKQKTKTKGTLFSEDCQFYLCVSPKHNVIIITSFKFFAFILCSFMCSFCFVLFSLL